MSDSTKRYGQTLDLQRDLLLVWYEQELDYNTVGTVDQAGGEVRKTGAESTEGLEQNPKDKEAATIRQYDVAAIVAAAIAADPISVPGRVAVRALPDVLYDVKVVFTKSSGDGAGNQPESQQTFSTEVAGSGGFNPRDSAQGSAAIVPTVLWDRQSFSNVLVNCDNYFFRMASPVTMAQILTRLTTAAGATVLNLPLFFPREVTLAKKGGQISVRSSADSDSRLTYNSDTPPAGTFATAYGDEYSKEVGVTTNTDIIPETLHDEITMASNTDTQAVTVSVSANILELPFVFNSTPTVIPEITNEPADVTGTASASVLSFAGTAVIPATIPIDIPRTGLYLVDLAVDQDILGLVNIHAIVVNFTQYA